MSKSSKTEIYTVTHERKDENRSGVWVTVQGPTDPFDALVRKAAYIAGRLAKAEGKRAMRVTSGASIMGDRTEYRVSYHFVERGE